MESVIGKDAAAAGGAKPKTRGSRPVGPPLPGRSRTALTQAQRDMIKGGAMISRARSGHSS